MVPASKMHPTCRLALLAMLLALCMCQSNAMSLSVHVPQGQWNVWPNNTGFINGPFAPALYPPYTYAYNNQQSTTQSQWVMGFHGAIQDTNASPARSYYMTAFSMGYVTDLTTSANVATTTVQITVANEPTALGYFLLDSANSRVWAVRGQHLYAWTTSQTTFYGPWQSSCCGNTENMAYVYHGTTNFPQNQYFTSSFIDIYGYHVGIAVQAGIEETYISWCHYKSSYYGGKCVSPAVFSSSTSCYTILYDRSLTNYYVGCNGILAINAVDNTASKGGNFQSSNVNFMSLGAGNYLCGALYLPQNLFYLGSDIGIGIEVSLATLSIQRICFVFSSSGLSPFVSVFLDTSGTLPALFWGTSDGQVARVNLRDFTVFASVQSPNPNDTMVAHFLDQQSGNLYYGAGSFVITSTFSNTYTDYVITRNNCTQYDCVDCLSVDLEYCGMCLSNIQCTTQSACPGAWVTSMVCPVPQYLSVTNGSLAGNTQVIYYGSYFNTSYSASAYTCSWTLPDGSIVSATATAVTSTSVTCYSATASSAGNAQLAIKLNGNLWSGNLGFKYYNCASQPCATCVNNPTYPECGWCFSSGKCTAAYLSTSTTGRCDTQQYWQNVCPSLGNFTVTTASTVQVRNNIIATSAPYTGLPMTGFSYSCRMLNTLVPAQISATAITCLLSNLSTASTLTTPIAISKWDGSVTYTADSLTPFQLYNCSGLTQCYSCSAPTANHPQCNWCTNQSCIDIGAGSCTTSICASVTSINPQAIAIQSLNGSTVDLYGQNINGSIISNCYYINGIARSTSASIVNSTYATCPVSPLLTAGTWQVGLGNSIGVQTAQIPLKIYNCSSFTSCDTCLSSTTTQCNWCNDIGGNLGCYPLSNPVSCNQPLSYIPGVCPSISYADPDTFPVTGNLTVLLEGNFSLTSTSAGSASCLFTHPSQPDQLEPVSFINSSTVTCNTPAEPTGTTSVSLVGGNGISYTDTYDLSYVSCGAYTSCNSCLVQPFCVWCGGLCQSTCSDPSLLQGPNCPYFLDVSPSYSSSLGGQQLIISGGNFIPVTSKKRDATELAASVIDRLATVDYSVRQQSLRNAVQQLSGAASYSCAFMVGGNSLSTVTALTNVAGTQIYCQSPPLSQSGTITLTVLFNGQPYLSTSGIEYFTCPSVASSYCSDSCAAVLHCGWCVTSRSCVASAICPNDVWQSGACISASLSTSSAPIQGGAEVTAILSGPDSVPVSFTSSSLMCDFGGTQVQGETETSNDTVSVTCLSPQVPSASTTSFGIKYAGNDIMAPVPFTFIDCSVYTACSTCIANDGCGYCSKTSKCTSSIQCPAASWSTTKCPINKVSLGVGLGIGLPFLLLLIVGLLLLIRRLRRKSGLVIAVREPNYAEIAWGNDTTLGWRIPEHNYKLLEEALARRDFLLPLAIAFNCPSTEQEALSKALVYVASYHGLAAEMIQTCIRAEVMNCKAENTLFRNNSVASKMYKFFSRIVGIRYLFNCIARVIAELEVLGQRQASAAAAAAANPGSGNSSLLNVSLELDQTKVLDESDIDTETNLLQLQLICQKIMNVLTRTALDNIPTDFRTIFVEIDSSVMTKFAGSNDAVYKGIGGLYFLRFVCPAITAPHVYGLLEAPPNPVTQRQLVLISKVIQNIANMQEPGKKEEYMAALKDFIVTSIPKIIKFYDHLRQAFTITETKDEQPLVVPDNVRLNGLAIVWNFLFTEKEKIRSWARSPGSPFDDMQQNDFVSILDDLEREYHSAPKKVKNAADAGTQAGATAESKKPKSKSKV